MLAELTPKPECVTVAIGTCMMDLTQMWTEADVKGTHLEDPKKLAAWAGMYTDAGPAFYLEHLKRLTKHGIQPYFPLAHVHQIEILERLIRKGVYMGPVNMETLQNLGLPPNRPGGEPGFLVWETDGRKSVAHVMSDSHPMAYCMVPPEVAKAGTERAGLRIRSVDGRGAAIPIGDRW